MYAIKSCIESYKNMCVPVKVLINLCYLGKEIPKQPGCEEMEIIKFS